MVPSGHDTGKTFVAAAAANYWFDVFDPSVVITTAPTKRDVVDLLWTEIRLQRQRAGLPAHFIGPSAPEMRTSGDHYAKGYTAVKGESFQGRHRQRMLFLFDEACGIQPMYWITTKTMFDADLGHAFLGIYNPTDTTSAAYLEENLVEADGRPRYHVFRLSSLDHPNVLADLRNEKRPIPGAVNATMVGEWVKDWCEPVTDQKRRICAFEDSHNGQTVQFERPEDGLPAAQSGSQPPCRPRFEDGIRATDVEWPPGSGSWYRPGPLFQARAQGLWPDQGSGVWSDALWQACLGPEPEIPLDLLPQIGADMATGKGEDYHGIHCRWGAVSVHHETANTMDAARIYSRLKELASDMAALATRRLPAGHKAVDPNQIIIRVDDDGTGNAVAAFLRRDGLWVVPIGAGTASLRPDRYKRKRDELWFATAERARAGLVNFSRLDKLTQRRLKQQLMAPTWDIAPTGQRVVESKDDTKEKIGRSPDDADAVNLAYLETGNLGKPVRTEAAEPRSMEVDYQHSAAQARGMFGVGGAQLGRQSAARRRGLFGQR
jgi:hypothetical protein